MVQPQPMTIAVIMANSDWVKGNQDLVQRYMTAWLRGAREYCQAYHGAPNRQEVIDELVNSKTAPSRELLEKYPWPARSPNGKINAASMLDINRWYVTNKLSTQGIPGRAHRRFAASSTRRTRSSGRSSFRTRTASCRAAAS